RALDPDADLTPVVQERDPLGAEGGGQPLGQHGRARSLRHDDSHLHLDPPQARVAAARWIRVAGSRSTRLLRVDLRGAACLTTPAVALCETDYYGLAPPSLARSRRLPPKR